LQGDFARALAYGQELAQFGQDAADRLMWGDALGAQGFAEQRLGRLDEALIHLKQAIEITEASGNIYFRLLVGNDLGQCYLRLGEWQAALDTLETNHQFIVKNNFSRDPGSNTMLRNGLAWAYLLAAEKSDPEEKAAWLKKAGRACRAALKWGKSFQLGKPEALRLQGRYEWLQGNTAQAQGWWYQSLAEAERLGTRYELGLTHLEIGQRSGIRASQERSHLEKAEAIFSEIGAQLDLAWARESIALWAGEGQPVGFG
jgi:tetratricopeptide (TPR) repeat protein